MILDVVESFASGDRRCVVKVVVTVEIVAVSTILLFTVSLF